MKRESTNDKNKIRGIAYAVTDAGLELPVIDITHPLFLSTIDEDAFKAESVKAAHKAKRLKNLPSFIKRKMTKIMKTENTYMSGISTLVLKLGPNLIKGRKLGFWSKFGTKQLNAMALRMRLREMCRYQVEILIPQLKRLPRKALCFINIAGGPASDTINTLILIQKQDPLLLKDRKIEINILDLDASGTNFAKHSIEALREPNAYFGGLDISFRHIQNNWNHTQKLSDVLSERKDWIQICASEGGLFEYGSDEEIIENLKILYDESADEMRIVGSLVFDEKNIHPYVFEGMKIMGVTARLIGLDRFKGILDKTNWMLDGIRDDGTMYHIFSLKKSKLK